MGLIFARPNSSEEDSGLCPDLPVQEMQSMTDVMADPAWLERLSATLISLVADLAIALAVREYTAWCLTRSAGEERKWGFVSLSAPARATCSD
jgi:hypothetical protein